MLTNTTITINSTDPDNDNKKVTDNINYINPNISDNTAIELAQRINNLTNNTYTETTRTDKRTLDTMPERVFDSIKFSSGSININVPEDGVMNINAADLQHSGYYRFQLSLQGSQPLCMPTLELSTTADFTLKAYRYSYDPVGSLGGADTWSIIFTSENDQSLVIPSQVITAKVTFPAYGGFASWSKTFTFNITAAE